MWSWLRDSLAKGLGYDDGDGELDREELLFAEDAFATASIEWRYGCKVTRVEEEYYLLDDVFYWPKTIPLGDPRFGGFGGEIQVGRKVRAKVTRNGDHEEWRVLEVLDDQNEEDAFWQEGRKLPSWFERDGAGDLSGTHDLLASVERVQLPKIFLTPLDEVGSKPLECDWWKVGLDYYPWKGDLLTLQTEIGQDGKVHISKARPLRYDEGSGEITYWKTGELTGKVRNDIFFSRESCPPSYYPRTGDGVNYHAVECQANTYNFQCEWRAIRLVPRGGFLRQKPTALNITDASLARQQWLANLLENKKGLQVENEIVLPPFQMGEERKVFISVRNTAQTGIDLTEVRFCQVEGEQWRRATALQQNSFAVITELPLRIESHAKVDVELTCRASLLGLCKEVVIFDFEKQFQVGTILKVSVDDAMLRDMMPKKRFFCGNDYSTDQQEGTMIIPGQKRVVSKTRSFLPTRLPQYDVPRSMQRYLQDDEDSLLDHCPTLGEPLVWLNFTPKFSALLHIEEVAVDERMKQYNMRGVIFQAMGQYLSLEVPGLCEKRPSLMLGDSLIATSPQSQRSGGRQVSYEGNIHEVRSRSVLFMCEQNFHNTYCGEMYDVQFRLNRNVFRKMHQAIQVAKEYLGEKTLFPSEVKLRRPQVDIAMEGNNCTRIFNFRGFPAAGATNGVARLASSKPSKNLVDDTGSISSGSHSSKSGDNRRIEPGDEWVTPVLPFRCPLKGKTKETALVCQQQPPSRRLKYQFVMNSEAILPPYRQKGSTKKRKRISWLNRGLNLEQRQAVTRIVLGEARPLPYIIYGPPGTGKTVTVVECVLQIYRLRPDSRVLVATPSNSSADLIMQRLHASGKVKPGQMARLNAFQRNVDSVPEELHPFCFVNDDENVLRAVIRHRIVIATCLTAGGLYKLGFRRGHFTHCFLDEAGHTTEPEALIPLGLVASGGDAQIVLAGDPMQLGPVLQSSLAKMYGLEESMLERLCNSRLYSRDEEVFRDHGGYDPVLVTKLVRNYRSHKSIIEIPSRLFYHNDLKVCAPRSRRERFLGLPFLPNQTKPVIFHGVRGENYQEDDSPSWFNLVEALQVVTYARRLLNECGVDPEDIGIVAPYRKQAEKIRTMMNSFELPYVKLGSVEEFQGQERPVIIVTTVRSSASHVESDVIHGLGFMQSEKRMNVALTRAQSLLIVVGDPHTLGADLSWRTFLEFCCDGKCYVGCDLPLYLKGDKLGSKPNQHSE